MSDNLPDISTAKIQGLTVYEVAFNPNTYPEEVCCAGYDVLDAAEKRIKEMKLNIKANLIGRMKNDNATKIPFVDIKGNERMLTLKQGTMKVNPDIDPEEFIRKHNFDPQQFGRYGFILDSWSKIKEKKKLGGDVQLVCDELYVPGMSTIDIK